MLTVFNVGQGDAMIIRPPSDCNLKMPPLLIDTGPARSKVADKIIYEQLNVLLTHSHRDHIGGMPRLMRQKFIRRLIMPYYLPEITEIYEYLRKYCTTKIGRVNWDRINQLNRLQLVSEGDELCRHARILNPPKSPRAYFEGFIETNEPGDIELALSWLREFGFDLPDEEIINYMTPIRTQGVVGMDENYNDLARKFVHLFFITLSKRIHLMPRDGADYYANSHFEMTANQASVVFVYKHPQIGKWLFTGDADQAVFNRLIREGKDISAKYLKVPHHGSRENMSTYILSKIAPEVAIISHGNRRFGQSKDSHPHHEVIDMLDARHNVQTYYTNDVIKGLRLIKYKTVGRCEEGAIKFE